MKCIILYHVIALEKFFLFNGNTKFSLLYLERLLQAIIIQISSLIQVEALSYLQYSWEKYVFVSFFIRI